MIKLIFRSTSAGPASIKPMIHLTIKYVDSNNCKNKYERVKRPMREQEQPLTSNICVRRAAPAPR